MNMLELRRERKAKKPTFLREDLQKRKKLSAVWKKPNGLHSKMRVGKAGHRKMPTPSFSSPVEVRGLTKHGFIPVTINYPGDLMDLNAKTHAVMLGRNVGKRSRIALIALCEKAKLKILNVNNPAEYVAEINDWMKNKKDSKKAAEAKKTEIAVKQKKEEKPLEETEEQKKDREKKDLDKLLTKREQ